jgi:hypothetical protein
LTFRAGAQDFYFLLLLYGDWFVGFSDTPSDCAFPLTALSVRPSFRPITRVGVFSFANCLSCFTSSFVQDFPVFRVDFVGIALFPPFFSVQAQLTLNDIKGLT